MTSLRLRAALLVAAALLGGCAITPPPAVDYSALLRNKPASLLVLPPVNESPEVNGTAGTWAHATRPLAEGGYYVLPVTLVDETLRQNGIASAQEAHDIPPARLREVFGADAVVYLRVKRYGTSYAVLASETVVEVEASIVDLRSGEALWSGRARASSAEQQQHQSGLVGLLVTAVVQQVLDTATDAAYRYADVANQRLLSTRRYNGLLPGPRSPRYGEPPVKAR